jgi:hypothetical protein
MVICSYKVTFFILSRRGFHSTPSLSKKHHPHTQILPLASSIIIAVPFLLPCGKEWIKLTASHIKNKKTFYLKAMFFFKNILIFTAVTILFCVPGLLFNIQQSMFILVNRQ